MSTLLSAIDFSAVITALLSIAVVMLGVRLVEYAVYSVSQSVQRDDVDKHPHEDEDVCDEHSSKKGSTYD